MRRLLSRGRLPYLLLLAVTTAWLGWHAGHVGIEQDNESMNTRDPAQLATYASFKAAFGNDEDLLVALTHPGLLRPAGLRLIAALTREIGRLDGVRRVYSLTNAEQIVAGSLGAEVVPLVVQPTDEDDSAAPEREQALRAAIDRNPHLDGVLISPDRRTAGFVVEIEDRDGDPDYRARLVDSLRALEPRVAQEGGTLHLTGIVVQKLDVGRFVQRDQNVLVPLAAVVLGVLLAVSFRRLSAVVLPLAVTGVCLAWTMGAYSLLGFELNPVTSLLPPVIMVLSIGTSVHLYHGWLAASRLAKDPVDAITSTVRTLVLPCFFTALTTALGLGSLLASSTPAVQQFGGFAAAGVLLSFLVALTLLPVGWTFSRAAASDPDEERRRGTAAHVPAGILDGLLVAAARLSLRAPRTLLATAGLLTLAAAAALPLVRNNTDLVRFLAPDSALRRDTLFIDENLGGANTVEFVIARTDGAKLTSLADVERIARWMKRLSRGELVTGVYGITDLLRQIQRGETGGDRLDLPSTQDELDYAFDLISGADDHDLVDRFLASDLRRMRVTMRMHAVGSERAARVISRAVVEARAILGGELAIAPTGAYYHVVHDSNRLVGGLARSFALAFLLVIPAIGVLFRSPKIMLVSIIPNLMPIVWTGGLMGVAGIDLSTGTAMIASVVIGLAVDDTIHYLARFRREYDGDSAAAITRTTTGTGRALVVASLVLVLGFWVGCFGSFQPTVYFSLLSGATMISALLCDLLLLPACLVTLDPSAE